MKGRVHEQRVHEVEHDLIHHNIDVLDGCPNKNTGYPRKEVPQEVQYTVLSQYSHSSNMVCIVTGWW